MNETPWVRIPTDRLSSLTAKLTKERDEANQRAGAYLIDMAAICAEHDIKGLPCQQLRFIGEALTAKTLEADGLRKLLGMDTPWPATTLLKALVVAERELRKGGRDFDGWESIQHAAQVAEQRLDALSAADAGRAT